MPLPGLQQRAVDAVVRVMDALGDTHDPSDARLKAGLAVIHDTFAHGSDQSKIMAALLTAFIKTEYPKKHFDYYFKDMLTAFAAGDFDVAYNAVTLSSWQKTGEGRGFSFSKLEGSRFTLHLIAQDALTKKFGEEGRCLAHSLAVCQSGAPIPMAVLQDVFAPKNYILQDADHLVVDEMQRLGVNPFADLKIMEIGATTESTAQKYPVIGLFSNYDNVNDTSGGYLTGAIPATPRSGGAISLSNFHRQHAYDYVVSSNVLSHKAMGNENMPIKERLYHGGDLFCTCANALKTDGIMFHLNGYEKERIPALGDADLHRFIGVQALAAGDMADHGKQHIYAYRKAVGQAVTLEQYDRWHALHGRDWALLPAFELKCNTGFSYSGMGSKS